MSLPGITEDLLGLLDYNGWNTAAFRRKLDIADWPEELRLRFQSHHYQDHQVQAALGSQLSSSPPLPSSHLPTAGYGGKRSGSGSGTGTGSGKTCCTASGSAVRISDVVAREAAMAYGRIQPYVRHTPLEPSPWLSNVVCSESSAGGGSAAGCTALLKLESEQHTGSFKVRGALSKLLSLPRDALSHGVFTASTGNHALAVLYACAALTAERPTAVSPPIWAPAADETSARGGVDGGLEGAAVGVAPGRAAPPLKPQLYVPTTASPYKVHKLRSLGAELNLYGTDCLQAELAARAAAAAAGAVYVSPYNDPWVMAGAGTVALELLAARRRGQLDLVLVPVGGGGLIGGMASVLKAADPCIRVVGCQPAASDVMARSVAAGVIVPERADGGGGDGCEDGNGGGGCDGGGDGDGGGSGASSGGTLSDATAGGVEYDSITLQPCTDCVDEWITLDEQEIAEALVGLLQEQSKLVEGAAACGLAAFRRLAPCLAGCSVVVVCCGGNIALPSLRRALDMAAAEAARSPAAAAAVS